MTFGWIARTFALGLVVPILASPAFAYTFSFEQLLGGGDRSCPPPVTASADSEERSVSALDRAYRIASANENLCRAHELASQLASSEDLTDSQRAVWAKKTVEMLFRNGDFAGAAGVGLRFLRDLTDLQEDESFRKLILDAITSGVHALGREHDPRFLQMALGLPGSETAFPRALSLRALLEDFPDSRARNSVKEQLGHLWKFYVEREVDIAEHLSKDQDQFLAAISRLSTLYVHEEVRESPLVLMVLRSVAKSQLGFAQAVVRTRIFDLWNKWPDERLRTVLRIENDEPINRVSIAREFLKKAKGSVTLLRQELARLEKEALAARDRKTRNSNVSPSSLDPNAAREYRAQAATLQEEIEEFESELTN